MGFIFDLLSAMIGLSIMLIRAMIGLSIMLIRAMSSQLHHAGWGEDRLFGWRSNARPCAKSIPCPTFSGSERPRRALSYR